MFPFSFLFLPQAARERIFHPHFTQAIYDILFKLLLYYVHTDLQKDIQVTSFYPSIPQFMFNFQRKWKLPSSCSVSLNAYRFNFKFSQFQPLLFSTSTSCKCNKKNLGLCNLSFPCKTRALFIVQRGVVTPLPITSTTFPPNV